MTDFNIGMRVKIIHQPRKKYSRYDLVGLVGTVRSNYGCSNVAIEIDGLKNPASGPGYFYISRAYFDIIDNDEEDNMSVSTASITGYVNAIRVKYIGEANRCSYVFACFEPDIQVGDLVVVKPAHHSISLARVDEILDGTDYETVREVVCKVDTSAYNERVKVRNQVAELKAKMEARARQLQDISLYQLLAKNDSEMQELLAQYQSIANI